MRPITREDTCRHQPDAADPTWQESLCLAWADERSGCAGNHHISLCPDLGLAHVWTWLVVEGREVARSQEHRLPLPADDMRDMRLGVLHLLAGESLRELQLAADFGDVTLSLDFEAFFDPFHIALEQGEQMTLGRQHYEAMGRVTGVANVGGRGVEIRGGAWHDHSWGARRLSRKLASRWIFAVFGDDFAISLLSHYTTEGQVVNGYVWQDGRIDLLTDARCGVVIGDDGLSPEGCNTLLRTRSGRCYELQGEVLSTALVGGTGWSGDGGHFWMDGVSRFRCGGRVGSGIMETYNLKVATDHIRQTLNY